MLNDLEKYHILSLRIKDTSLKIFIIMEEMNQGVLEKNQMPINQFLIDTMNIKIVLENALNSLTNLD
jgi:hypothetical protein